VRTASGYGMAALACLLVGMIALAPRVQAQQTDDEPVGWPLPKSERPTKPRSERTPLLPVAPAPQVTAPTSADRASEAGKKRLPGGSEAQPSQRPAATMTGEDVAASARRREETATGGELAPLNEVILGAKPLVFAFAPDQYVLSADDVRLIERFAAGVRAASGIVDVLVWVTPPAAADEQARRQALERAFARGLYLRALLREAGLPASRIDILATAQPAPQEKDMPSPAPAEGARIRLASNFMTGVR